MKNYNPYSLQGKTILITGASSGIGRATAIECSKMGANVIITARNEERLNETYSKLDTSEGQIHQIIKADLNKADELQGIVDNIVEINGLVNNAGIGLAKPIQFIKEEDLNTIFDTNTFAPVLLTQKLLKKKK